MEIRIISTPPGAAPEEIRRAWIGITLPVRGGRFGGRRTTLGAQVPIGPHWLFRSLFALVTGRGTRQTGYQIESSKAMKALAAHSPQAAEWWRQNAPHAFVAGRYLFFEEKSCEVLAS